MAGRAIGQTRKTRFTTEDRSAIVYGVTIPTDKVNCGLLNEAILSNYNTPYTSTVTLVDGETIEDKIIWGDVRLPGTHNSDITVRNCLFMGGADVKTTNDGVIKGDTNRTGTGKLKVYDSEIRPIRPWLNRDGVRGNRVELYRVTIRDVIDGISFFATSGQNGGVVDSVAKGCLVEDLLYMYPDYDNGSSGAAEHSDGTHNDALAIQGGANVTIEGCYFNATSWAHPDSGTNPNKPWLIGQSMANGAACIVNEDAGTQTTTTCSITKNWFRGGLSQLNVKTGTTFIFTDNKHYTTVAVGTGHSGYWIRFDPTPSTVTGVNDGGGSTVTNTTNVWADGANVGVALTSPRASGIQFD